MSKKQKIISGSVIGGLLLLLFLGSLLIKGGEKEALQVTMQDAVLHEVNRISLFGILEVNPGLIAAFTVTGIILVAALIIRIFVIPRFKIIPGKCQLLLEEAVSLFDRMAKTNSPHLNDFLGSYIFAAGAYIFISTIFELLGFQVITTGGRSLSLPAPLSDINGAIALAVMSFLVILSGGTIGNKLKGVANTLKDFSLPISMSFRLFGALLSGALVTELVYHSQALSYGLPVIVAVLFTLIHALIQAYVLTMLTSVFYGEVSEKG